MKRETIIASALGITLGALVAGGILVRLSYQGEDKNVIANVENEITPTVIPKEQESHEFDLEQPEDDILVRNDSVQISGVASEGSLIIIQSSTDQQVIPMEGTEFNVSFPLSIGENVILISFYPKNNTTVFEEKELHIYYMP